MSCRQLRILLWKCWIRRKRHWFATLVQFLLPLLMCLLVTFAFSKAAPQLNLGRLQPGNGTRGPFYYNQTEYTNELPRFQIGQGHFTADITLYFTPNNDFTRNIINDIKNRIIPTPNLPLVPASTVEEQNRLIDTALQEERGFYGIIFHLPTGAGTAIPKQLNYTIQLYSNEYRFHNFSMVQMAINEAYLSVLANEFPNRFPTNYIVQTRRFPYPRRPAEEFAHDPSYSIMTLILIYGGTYMATQIVKRIAQESSSKIKELLRMMGMSDWVFWTSHFLDFFIMMFIQTCIIVWLTRFAFGINSLFYYTDASLMFFVLILYSIQTILFCQLISTVFNQPVMSTIAVAIIWIAFYEVPNHLLFPESEYNPERNNLRILTCLLPQMSIKWFFAFVNHYEVVQVGLNWSNFLNYTQRFESFTTGIVILVMLLSFVMYIVLIWYLDAVWPWQMGVPKPFYFPFTKDYWIPKLEQVSEKSKINNQENIEEPPANCAVGISAKNLSKQFNGNYAVRNINLDIYHGHINVLLGHNGAGKTTTMSMMTGIFPPTSGTVIVDGYDIRKQTKQARQSMGMCPQDNAYYPDLTVEEHIIIFATIKGCPNNEIQFKVNELLRKLQLLDKTNVLAESLSGGMKRRLMLAMALINDTKILVLDEPTSGLDPESRRVVWDVLLETRANRTILLSTHYMEEAEALGDRISIMSLGHVVCSGTSMFLKKRFATGYRLRIAKRENFNREEVNETITKHIPLSKIQSEIASEIVYLLTTAENEDDSTIKNKFPNFFDELEQNKDQLGIASYGVSVNTIEEVFLKVGELSQTNNNKQRTANVNKETAIDFKPELFEKKVSGSALSTNRFCALIKKRFVIAKRHWKMMLFQLVIPSVVFFSSLFLFGPTNIPPRQQTYHYDIGLRGPTQGFLKNYTSGTEVTDLGRAYQRISSRRNMTTEFTSQDEIAWALEKAETQGIRSYTTNFLIGLSISQHSNQQIDLFPWFNPGKDNTFETLLPSIAMSINTMYEAMANYKRPENDLVTITVNEQAIASSFQISVETALGGYLYKYLTIGFFMMTILFTFISASFVLQPTDEKQSNSKLLQLMTGLSSTLFWLSNFIFDMIFYLLVVFLLFIIMFFFDTHNTLLSSNSAIPLFLTLFMFGFAAIPFAYLCSLYFSTSASGFQFIVILSMIIGFAALPIAKTIAYFVSFGEETVLGTIIRYASYIVHVIPTGAMLYGIQKIYFTNTFLADMCNMVNTDEYSCGNWTQHPLFGSFFTGCCPSTCRPRGSCYENMNYYKFSTDGLLGDFLIMLATGLILFIFVCFYDSGFFNFSSPNFFASKPDTFNLARDIDSDVNNEQNRILQLDQNKQLDSEAIAVIELKKWFSKLAAVDGLTFGVHKEECFGLLGVNGAGKTTTFRMLVGDLSVTGGNAFIGNISLRSHLKEFQQKIGYCPQFDALSDFMTVRETINLFAMLRGMARGEVGAAVGQLIQMVDLQDHVDKRTKNLSGGNKRKLSLAMAIIGTPPLIFLDEPTSGVDPAARRKIWSTLVFIQDKLKCSVILTSHSMDECESLCSRIAIMVNGKFQCLGSSQHLKAKFAQGYEIQIKMKMEQSQSQQYLLELNQMVMSQIPSAILKEHHQTLLQYQVTDPKTLWADLFRKMEQLKANAKFDDYTVGDSNLEQVFLMFARRQKAAQ